MNKRVAIHHYSGDFSDRWIEYCREKEIEYEIVDCYRNDIVAVMKNFDVLLWSWNLSHHESLQFAKELIYSLEVMGKKVFPDFRTSFFYDNKVGQKYILESVGAPLVPTCVFYDQESAKHWAEQTIFPKVFKLSGGAGSMNVQLCRTQNEALKLIRKSFSTGFSPVDRRAWFVDKVKKFKEKPSKDTSIKLIKAFGRLFIPTKKEKVMSHEKGYAYFQEFIPNNEFDIRVIVIGEKAFALKRLCRENDFRASGSGKIIYDQEKIDISCVKIAFDVSKKLDAQCMAYDFVFDINNQPLIVEMSYHFSPYAYDKCEGYWDERLHWHNEKVNPQYMIIEQLL
ncbi:MAG: hypothetical protein QG558_875, partial [Campylobacterota bacterium]|nr:hypothetical protein [Campylobacterota bacterium]